MFLFLSLSVLLQGITTLPDEQHCETVPGYPFDSLLAKYQSSLNHNNNHIGPPAARQPNLESVEEKLEDTSREGFSTSTTTTVEKSSEVDEDVKHDVVDGNEEEEEDDEEGDKDSDVGYDGDDEENTNSYEDGDVDVEDALETEAETLPLEVGVERPSEGEKVDTDNLALLARWAEHEASLVDFKANLSWLNSPSSTDPKFCARWSSLLFVASYLLERIKEQEQNVSSA